MLKWTMIFLLVTIGSAALTEKQLEGSHSANLNFKKMSFFRGTCVHLKVQNRALACNQTLIHTEYHDGKIGFYIFFNSGALGFTAYSREGWEADDGQLNVPVIALVDPEKSTNAEGICSLKNYKNREFEPMQIRCNAISLMDQVVIAEFITDGFPPKVVHGAE